ncbi:MAG TPA: DUF2232 domain-containing protein [Gemmatimonadales bacterium]
MLRFVLGALTYFFALAFVSPVALITGPLALLLLFQRPTRRETFIGLLFLAFTVWSVTGAADGFDRVADAWVCLLMGGVAVALGSGAQENRGKLVSGGLMAVGAAGTAAVLVVLATPFSWHELYWLATRHYSMLARVAQEVMSQNLSNLPNGSELLQTMDATLDWMVEMVSRLLPALVLLQSVAALAMAWGLYRWFVRQPEGEPLPRLRDFRFSDQLIWGVVLSLVALVFPGVQSLHLIGGNLAAFFGGLYVVRGLGIVASLAGAAGVGGPFVALLASFLTIFLMPVVMIGALALGVTDTWVDWRKLALKAKKS